MADSDLAMRRVMLLTLVRLVGFAIVLGGFWLAGTAHGPTPRMMAGLATACAGLLIFLLVPRRMARRWKT